MGSNQSVGCQEIEVFIDHPNFTHAKVYTQNSLSKLVTTFSIEETLFRSWQKELASHQIMSQFSLLPETSHFTLQRYCSMKGSAKIVYGNYPYLLNNQIHDRAGKKQPFTEEQLWQLMLAIFSVKKQFLSLHINEGNLGNVTPQNIFLSQKGGIKVGNCLSWPGNKQLMEKIILQNSRQFIAPEDFIQLSLGMSYCKATIASQMFAIGMTVLSAVILKDSFDLYNFRAKKFNFNQALIRIQQMKKLPNYSDTLKATVELLCAFEVMDRIKMQQIGQILFRCENSIKLRKKFSAYPVGDKIEKKLREYKANQQVSFNTANLSIMSFTGQEMIPESPQNSKLAKLKRNSMNLTQVILGPHTQIYQKKSSSNTNSLMSSEEFVAFKKTQYDSKEEKEKPLQRYQEINANFGSNSLTDMDYLHLINMAKQVIIQKPVVIDSKRRSDDIEQETTPVETPLQTPHQSTAGGNDMGFNRPFQVPKQYSRESFNFNLVEKNPLSKTTTVNLHPNKSYPTKSTLKVKSTQSQDPSARREDIMKTQNSTITIYIPMNESLDQSLRSSWESQNMYLSKRPEKRNLQGSLPSLIQEYSREQISQIQLSKLSQKDKELIQTKILQKLYQMSDKNKKNVKFAQENYFMDLSHQSKILQIDDIDLDCMKNQNKRIIVGYKESNENELLVELVNISKKNSFVYINEDED